MKTFSQFVAESVEVNEISKELAQRYSHRAEPDMKAQLWNKKHRKVKNRFNGLKRAKKRIYRDEHPGQERYDSSSYKGD